MRMRSVAGVAVAGEVAVGCAVVAAEGVAVAAAASPVAAHARA
jgi:hypothetical protein